MQQQFPSEGAFVLRELDLGQHTLFVMSNKSIDLLANEKAPFPDNVMTLNHEEAYRFLVSLQTLFQQEGW
jgi:UDP-N-acetyl-D-mannosaminuronic acid transferase (WecB/TagA/CpsF family)